MVFEHPRHVEILDGNDVKPLHEHRGQLVQGIRADIRNLGMQPGDAPLGFLHVLRPRDVHSFGNGFAGLKPGAHFGGFPLATELFRQPTKRGQGGCIGLRSHDLLAGRECGQRGNAPIDPAHRLAFAMDTGRIGHLDGDTQKPAIRRAGDGAFDDSPDKPQRLVHVHPPKLRDMHLPTFDSQLIIGEGKAVVTALLLEGGILIHPGKEILKRLAPVHNGHLWRVFGHV